MNIKIVKNKYINSLLLLMLFSAIVHMVILCYFAVELKDVYILNYFNILDLDLLFGEIFNSINGNVISLLCIVLIYLVILKINTYE